MSNEGESNSTIMRNISGSRPEIVVFVGNGAINGGWSPLRFALDSWIGNDKTVAEEVTRLRKQDQEAFHQLALMSYKFKVARGLLFANWIKRKRGKQNNESIQESAQKPFSKLITNFLDLRINVAGAFQNSLKPMSLRKDAVIDDLIGTDAYYITTNWDNTLWTEPSVKNLIHLHGRCDYPDSIIFPTELVIEDTAFDFSFFDDDVQGLDQEFIKKVISTFRCNFIEALIAAHSKATKVLQPIKRIVIWGYSLGDYDADVNALIGTYTPEQQSGIELIVINPDPAALNRAVALTGITNARHYNPITQIMMTLKI